MMCVCVWGKCLLTFGERGIQKTLIPFVLAQSSWMLYYNNKYLTVKTHYVQQLKIQIQLNDCLTECSALRVLAEPP